jgi:DNA segregation ATPase FtsK/SpoIIIE, S-DNA-T family
MATIRRSSSPFQDLPDAARGFLTRRAAEIFGIALIVIALGLALALATWSVDDPSINNATRAHVKNWLGGIGAISADIMMQLFGIASLAVIAPLSIWGIGLVRTKQMTRPVRRAFAWVCCIGASATLAAYLPATARWPLPTGLGGVTGDGVARLFSYISGQPGGIGALIVGLIATIIAIFAFATACSGTASEEQDEPEPLQISRTDKTDKYDEPGFAMIMVGGIVHGFLSLKGALSRWKRSIDTQARTLAGADETHSAHAGTPEIRTTARRDPSFEAPAMTKQGSRILRSEPAFEPYEDDPEEDHVPAMAAEPRRVSAPPVAPKQGRRIEREAQPSFLDHDDYSLPALTLLGEPRRSTGPTVTEESLEQNAKLLEGVLDDFGVRGEIINVRPGPVVTLYELEPAPGTKSSRVISLADDIARSMSAISARVAVVSGRNAIGIELPNQKRETVYLRELLASQDFDSSKSKLALCLGKTIGGEPVIVDLARMPHLLVAGTTGSGKSVAINTMILSLLYRLRPEECRLIMIDPKMLELSVYDGIPHLLTPVVTDPKKAVVALKWAVREMEERYKKMSKLGVRNIDGFNARVIEAKAKGEVISRTVQTGYDRESGEAIYEDQFMELEPLPYLVVIVDEMADLMMVAGKDIEGAIQRLAQMARAAGIHVILATQRPSVDVITGTIKANFPTRISFQVTSKIDSRTILGEQGAEQLLGQGDMLHMAGGGRIMRVHGPFVSDAEVEKVVAHLKSQGRPNYLESVTAEEDAAPEGDDPAVFDQGAFGAPSGDLYDQAIALILRDKKASTSYIQRRLQIGYNRAASLMERMENEGIVGPANHAGKRDILIEVGEHESA